MNPIMTTAVIEGCEYGRLLYASLSEAT